MKRDLSLYRDILLILESDGELVSLNKSEEEISFYLALMEQAGLVQGMRADSADGMSFYLNDSTPITHYGYEFLDSIRNKSVWANIIKRTGSAAGAVSLAVMIEIAKQETKRFLGLSDLNGP